MNNNDINKELKNVNKNADADKPNVKELSAEELDEVSGGRHPVRPRRSHFSPIKSEARRRYSD